VSGSRADGLSLEVRYSRAVLLALTTSRIITLHAIQEILTTAGMTDVFCSNADLLLLDSVPDRLGDHHTKRSVGHVENAASATVVVLVRHTRMDGSIGLDVDDVSDLVDLQQRRDGRHAIFTEWPSEHVPSSPPISLGIRHPDSLFTCPQPQVLT